MGQAKEIVAKAREVLQRDGWCQGQSHTFEENEHGEEVVVSHCTLGALDVAVLELNNEQSEGSVWYTPNGTEAMDLICKEIEKDHGLNYSSNMVRQLDQEGFDAIAPHDRVHIPSWNDSENTTFEDVLLILKRAENADHD